MRDMLKIPPIAERRTPMDENTIMVAKIMALFQLLVTIGEIKSPETPGLFGLTKIMYLLYIII